MRGTNTLGSKVSVSTLEGVAAANIGRLTDRCQVKYGYDMVSTQ